MRRFGELDMIARPPRHQGSGEGHDLNLKEGFEINRARLARVAVSPGPHAKLGQLEPLGHAQLTLFAGRRHP